MPRVLVEKLVSMVLVEIARTVVGTEELQLGEDDTEDGGTGGVLDSTLAATDVIISIDDVDAENVTADGVAEVVIGVLVGGTSKQLFFPALSVVHGCFPYATTSRTKNNTSSSIADIVFTEVFTSTRPLPLTYHMTFPLHVHVHVHAHLCMLH